MTFLEILRALFEILVLWALFYQLYRAVKDSRAAAMLAGLIATVILGYILLEITHAVVLKQLAALIIGPGTLLVILFQPELRTALARFGSNKLISRLLGNQQENQDFVTLVRESVSYLVSKRYGALIAICRTNKLQECYAGSDQFRKRQSGNHSGKLHY